MNTDGLDEQINDLTERVIGCAFTVGNALGCGFLEKVYENALAIELRKASLHVQQQLPLHVSYSGTVVGEFAADLVVEGKVLVELKAVNRYDEVFTAQCLNYLKATGLPICLLINFGKPRVEIKRFTLFSH